MSDRETEPVPRIRPGFEAERPWHIPARGWLAALKRTYTATFEQNLSLVAAGVAFYALLAIFPAIAATISLWALLTDPAGIERQLAMAAQLLPPQAAGILLDQARSATESAGSGVSLVALFGLVIAIYSATRGTSALIAGLNIVYDRTEKRSFIVLTLLSIALAIGLVIGGVIALAALVLVPALIDSIGLSAPVRDAIATVRWPLLLCLAMLGLGLFYRFAPDREMPGWRWITPGAAIGTALWLAGSFGFSVYIDNFGSYGETYGALGAVIVLMIWLWLSAFVVLLGAELNQQLERQTGAVGEELD